jgi:heat shock protein HslJ
MRLRYIITLTPFVVLLLLLSACAGDETTPNDPLNGTSWRLFAYRKTKPLDGTEISANFEEGFVRGSAGCNSYGAPYQLDGEGISLGEIELTAMACLEPEGVMEQEAYLMDFLANVRTYSLEGEQLELYRADGEGLFFTPHE